MADSTQQRAAELFKACLDQEPDSLSAFIDERCRGDAELIHEVKSLLQADGCATHFLETPPQVVQSLAFSESNRLIGRTIGGFKIEKLLASGGMGTVFEATQLRLARTVALKVIRFGAASPAMLRRFEFEAKLLARLKHPGIAQIYEVGTHIDREGILGPANSSVPFFSMEYVANARTIVDHVRDAELTTQQRLELLAQVCDAVHYGHQHGVIHRDLKPTNILVGHDGSGSGSTQPKVIDFGVARAADGDPILTTLHTSYGQLVGTLQYMSPEQCGPTAAGTDSFDVDVRTDVYSLGLVLYEVLSGGEQPYNVQKMTLLEAAYVIREQSIPRLSAIDRRFRGDLETIVRKALEKERENRYQSAGELADDIRRYLSKEPIQARPPSVMYQLRAFARRNKAVMAAVAAVFLVLVGGVATTSWQAVRARQFAADAREAEQVANLRLRDSLIAQASATKLTGIMGQRYDSLDALQRSAKIGVTTRARSEAIAAMALPDLRVARRFQPRGPAYFDAAVERFAALNAEDGAMTIVRISDDAVIAEIPALKTTWGNILWVSLVGRYLTRAYDLPEDHPDRGAGRRLEVWLLPLESGPGSLRVGGEAVEKTKSTVVPQATLHLEFNDMSSPGRHDISPNGKRLALGRSDGAVHIYDIATKEELRRIPLDRVPSYLAFDHSGRRLALYHAAYQHAQILDLDTGQVEPAFDTHTIAWSVAWHPQDNMLAGAGGVQIELWNCEEHRNTGLLIGHQAQIVHVQYSHDGTKLLSYSWDGVAILWDVRTLRPLLRFNIGWPVFAPDDRTIAGTAYTQQTNEPQLRELDPALERRTFVGSGEPKPFFVTMYGAFSHNDRFLITAESFADEFACYRVFDVASGRETAVGPTREVGPMIVDPQGQFFLTAHKNGVYRWPMEFEAETNTVGSPECIFTEGPVFTLQLTAEGRLAVASGYSVEEFAVFDLQHGTKCRRIAHSVKGAVQISPDGHWATIHDRKALVVWDMQSETNVLELPLALTAFSPDGKWLATSSTNELAILEVGSWRVLRKVPHRGGELHFSPDSRLLVNATGSSSIELIDSATLQQIAILEPPENYYTIDVTFSEDGALLAQFTNHSGLVHVWDLSMIRAKLDAIGLGWEDAPIETKDVQRESG